MLVIDTSALVKRYLAEDGREQVLALMAGDISWAASHLARTEADIALCRVVAAGSEQARYRAELQADWARFVVVAADEVCLARAAEIGCATGLGTLDAIHLAAAVLVAEDVTFVTFDRRQAAAAATLGIAVAPNGIA